MRKKFILLGLIISSAAIYTACSKGSDPDPTPPNPCTGVTVTVTATTTNATQGQSNGTITASATGGSGFTFSKDGTNFQANGNFTGLAAGNYTITAKNSNGCTGSASFTVGSTNPCTGVTITVNGTVTDAAQGQSNGAINATAAGSTGFTFSKDGTNFQASGNFTGLAAGNYTITAKDAAGCTGTRAFTVGTVNPCAGVTINVSNNISQAIPCPNPSSGSITVTASGSTGPYMYSLNGGTFQSSNTFANLAAGSYVIVARDANGCNSSNANASVTNAPAGTLFSAVRTIIQTNCAVSGCHDAATQQSGINFSNDCQIVAQSARIKVRAVDQAGTPSQMPPPPRPALSAGDRQAITNWVNAGGGYTN